MSISAEWLSLICTSSFAFDPLSTLGLDFLYCSKKRRSEMLEYELKRIYIQVTWKKKIHAIQHNTTMLAP